MAITLTDIDIRRVIQRVGTVGTVPVAGTWTGTTPTSIQARIMKGAVELAPWTTVPGATIGAGTFSGSLPDVPQGDGYTLQARTMNGAAALETAVGVNTFGIGKVFGVIGSSTPDRWFTASTSESGQTAARKWRDAAGWNAITGASAIACSNVLLAHQPAIPVGLLHCGVSGSTLDQWDGAGFYGYDEFLTDVAQVGGKLEGVIVHIGTNDVRNGTVTSVASHLSKYRTLISNIRTAFGQPNLPFFIQGCHRSPGDTNHEGWRFARAAETVMDRDDANVYLAAVTVDLGMDPDNIHLLVADQPKAGQRVGHAINAALYGGSDAWRGPRPLSADYNSATGVVVVTFDLRGNAQLTGKTALTGITGFRYSTNGGSSWTAVSDAAVISASKVAFTIATGLGTVLVDYLYGAEPNVTNPVYAPEGEATVPVDSVAPTITSASTHTVEEDTVYNATATADETVTWSLSGTDAALVTLNATTGAWSLPGQDRATRTSVVFNLIATDAAGNASVQQNVVEIAEAATQWWLPDSTIDMDFVNQRYYANGSEVAISGLLTISRATQGTALKADGTTQVFAAGQFRITDRGLTIWDAATVGGVSEAADNIDPINALLTAIRGAEGMFLFEFEKTDMTGSNGFARLYHTGSASTHNRTLWLDVPAGTLTASTNDSGTGQNVTASGTYTAGTIGKAARAWKNGEVELICLSGGTVVASAGVKIPVGTLSPNAIGRRGGDNTRYWRGRIRRITFWPTKPTTSVLQARATL